MLDHEKSVMLLGALVADAAGLGLHWLYDAERIAEITKRRDGECAFTPVDPANYEGAQGYFAHGARCSGMLSQYGEVLLLAIQSMNTNGGSFDVQAYQSDFAAYFGAGGAYTGYIDRPTRAALENIAAGTTPSGSDDDQLPALARLPAILAAYHGADELPQMISHSMHVTNVNDVAAAYSSVFADVFSRVMQGEPLHGALEAVAAGADQYEDKVLQADLLQALSTSDDNSTDYAGLKGRACHLTTAGSVMFHILKHSDSYEDAINRNILAGGDSAGRSIVIGAIMALIHGVGTPKGIPLAWILQVKDAAQIWGECTRLCESHE